ncbi:MAG: DUF2304 domain-containing protein [Actinomycetota bacterium]|nr:DUF2304 domain-containing protein [Actinomycetota bacterium]
MSSAAQVLTIVIAVAGFVLVLFLVRTRRLKERFAATWLIVGAGMVVLALARPLLDRLSDSLGIQSGTTTVFLIAVLVILGIQLQLSVSLSRMEERLRDLAEAFALEDPISSVKPSPSIEDGDDRENSA